MNFSLVRVTKVIKQHVLMLDWMMTIFSRSVWYSMLSKFQALSLAALKIYYKIFVLYKIFDYVYLYLDYQGFVRV